MKYILKTEFTQGIHLQYKKLFEVYNLNGEKS